MTNLPHLVSNSCHFYFPNIFEICYSLSVSSAPVLVLFTTISFMDNWISLLTVLISPWFLLTTPFKHYASAIFTIIKTNSIFLFILDLLILFKSHYSCSHFAWLTHICPTGLSQDYHLLWEVLHYLPIISPVHLHMIR